MSHTHVLHKLEIIELVKANALYTVDKRLIQEIQYLEF